MMTAANPRLARIARPALLTVGLAALLLAGCSSSQQQPSAYIHVDPGVGLITSSDSLGSFVSARVNSERREARARAIQPTALTSVEAQ